jgi:hypothetical protein
VPAGTIDVIQQGLLALRLCMANALLIELALDDRFVLIFA